MSSTPPIPDEIRYRLLTYLTDHPNASQREVARVLGVSVGKVNYCLQALIRKGLVKMRNFHESDRKSNYLYVLTRKGMEERINVTVEFLRRKRAEYDALTDEIERLTAEVSAMGAEPADDAV